MSRSYWVQLRFATFGFEVEDGVVVNAPPIARYIVGWDEKRALKYFRGRGQVSLISETLTEMDVPKALPSPGQQLLGFALKREPE